MPRRIIAAIVAAVLLAAGCGGGMSDAQKRQCDRDFERMNDYSLTTFEQASAQVFYERDCT